MESERINKLNERIERLERKLGVSTQCKDLDLMKEIDSLHLEISKTLIGLTKLILNELTEIMLLRKILKNKKIKINNKKIEERIKKSTEKNYPDLLKNIGYKEENGKLFLINEDDEELQQD